MPRERRVVIVANRLPVQRSRSERARWETSPGGLVTALLPVAQRRRGAWVGWTGTADRNIRAFSHQGIAIQPVTLTDAEIRDYYHGFGNRTLWPLFHDAIRTPEFHRHWWRSYTEVNQRLARAAVRAARPGDIVWVHDFHLLLAPAMIRAIRPDLRIGFFLHIPFPPEELFAWLPWRVKMLEGLLGADLVGFQIQADARNFSRLARDYAGAEGTDSELVIGDRVVKVGAFPISIDFDAFNDIAERPEVIARAREIRKQIGASRKIILCVDRLDYTKGIDVRLHAWETMLEQGDASVDRHVLIQVAVPSRESVPDYATLRSEVEGTVGRINGEFSQPGRVAVHYFRRNLPREELVAYYRAADVMLVGPLRDGMNLVCKEFIASRPDHGGVLVLSEFAGAARELRRALLINPRDVDGLAYTLRTALTLPSQDAKQRMAILRMMVRRHNVHVWAQEFLEAITG
jgi:trehalose 6-phosphate synthase